MVVSTFTRALTSPSYPSFIDVNVLVVIVNDAGDAHLVAAREDSGQVRHQPLTGRVIRGEPSVDTAKRTLQDVVEQSDPRMEQIAVFENVRNEDDSFAHDIDIVYGIRLSRDAEVADLDAVEGFTLEWRPVMGPDPNVPLAPELLQPLISDWMRTY